MWKTDFVTGSLPDAVKTYKYTPEAGQFHGKGVKFSFIGTQLNFHTLTLSTIGETENLRKICLKKSACVSHIIVFTRENF